ncbi:MAG: CapA family protein [Chloroflexi bacterium]|nr:CapA family protein [Chloroflexota bacterium]
MLYEAEPGDILMAFTGDSMITRPHSLFREPRFLELRELLRRADMAFANLEMLVHLWEGSPGFQTGTYTATDPANLEELKWLGINIVSCANNHSFDYGETGALENKRNLERSGLPHAGSGRNLAEAQAPAYLETPRGRVALIAATSTFREAARAGQARPDMHGRVGINTLRHQVTYTADREAFEQLRRLSRGLGLEVEKEFWHRFGTRGPMPQDTDTEFHFLDRKFVLGEEFRTTTRPHPEDLDGNLRWVREARRQADWVLVSLHNHEFGATREEPAQFVVEFAHACIEAGADAFIGHGPHFDRGIEVYRGRPIFYALGNFIFQNEAVRRLPHDAYSRFGLGMDATPSDYYDARSANDTQGFPADPVHWRTVVAQVEFRRKELAEVRLIPVDLGFGRPRPQRGRPVLAEGEVARQALEQITRLSEPFRTRIEVRDGVGVIEAGQ